MAWSERLPAESPHRMLVRNRLYTSGLGKLGNREKPLVISTTATLASRAAKAQPLLLCINLRADGIAERLSSQSPFASSVYGRRGFVEKGCGRKSCLISR
jgi:hypothetical protein